MFDVGNFVVDCRAALGGEHTPTAVRDVLDRALGEPTLIDEALGGPKPGGIYPLHRSDDLTVLQIVWPPHVSLFPHDHQMWAAIGIYLGREDNTFFRRGPEGIEPSGGKELDAGDVVLLGREVIHAVQNPGSSYTAAIHVYGGDFFAAQRSEWDPKTFVEQPFDVEHARAVLAAADEAARSEH